uniref:Uncharacterized protein n=1 Tax=Rhizophora mucronata TaxID=61149 RepID=A0A2P2QAA7_RHIMU
MLKFDQVVINTTQKLKNNSQSHKSTQ